MTTLIEAVRTDADGRFAIRLPRRGRFALAAQATRRLLNETEEYVWMVWVTDEMKKSGSVFLSNDNLSTTGGPDVVFHAER